LDLILVRLTLIPDGAPVLCSASLLVFLNQYCGDFESNVKIYDVCQKKTDGGDNDKVLNKYSTPFHFFRADLIMQAAHVSNSASHPDPQTVDTGSSEGYGLR
jgi:hypothetical protein